MAQDRPRKGPTLPLHLLREINSQGSAKQVRGCPIKRALSRKDQRKEARLQKKTRFSARKRPESRASGESGSEDAGSGDEFPSTHQITSQPGTGKRSSAPALEITKRGQDDSDISDDTSGSKNSFDGLSEDEEDEEDENQSKAISKGVRDRLEQDDAEIAALEKRLGIRGRKLPKSFQDDGLVDLLGDIDGDVGGKGTESRKRKAEYEDWLSRKRSTTSRIGTGRHQDTTGDGQVGDDFSSLEGDGDGDGDDSGLVTSASEEDSAGENESDVDDEDDIEDGGLDDFDGFESADDESAPATARPRENPYAAPTTGNVAKYVPPAARKNSKSDDEITAQIQRQAQGLMNRMSDSNLVSILVCVEQLYREHPRSHVSTIMVDLLLKRVCESTNLLDKYMILYGGFATAVYRTIGVDFGAKLVQEAVNLFEERYNQDTKTEASTSATISKETSNLIGLISQLYTFQLVGSRLVFDYIRLLLAHLSELNAELLLRIIRTCGPSLRQDDPLALKDIVALIRPSVAAIGEKNLSVRTRFMIDTINDLKNNRMKAGAADSAANAEHTAKMRKLLGSLNSRKLKATEPLRLGLKDIRDSDSKGKWWLVGASWAGNSSQDKVNVHETAKEDSDHSQDDMGQDDGFPTHGDEYLPDLWKLAREQKINTVTQQSIFAAILSSADFEDAYARLQKLRLNKDRRGEMATVLMQCVGAEEHYNPYYTLVANKICSADRKVRYSFQDSLWKFFRRLGQPIFDDEEDEVDEDDDISMRRIVNVAKMFGSLVARGALGLSVLKCLDMPYLQSKTKVFVEVMLVTILLEIIGDKTRGTGEQQALDRVFTTGTLDQIRGLQWFLKKVIRQTDLVEGEEKKALRKACKLAETSVEKANVASNEVERED